MEQSKTAFWHLTPAELLDLLQTTPNGLTSSEASQRQVRKTRIASQPKHVIHDLKLLIAQFSSPIILILVFAAILSIFLHDQLDAGIILTIVGISGLLGFFQERGAANAVAKLLALVQVTVQVLRDGKELDIPAGQVVPGDVVILDAGDIIPGDCYLLETTDLYLDEAALTGETFPVEKKAAILPEDTPLSQRSNVVWMGTHVISGDARVLVVNIGEETEFGKVSTSLKSKVRETEFEHGIRRFGYLLMEITLVIVFIIFGVNVFLKRPVLDSFLFSLALAVGLTPQLLPAIISINLSHGARKMAQKKVIVKRLASIENFGSMNVLCSDKTGTLTEGVVRLQDTLDSEGKHKDKVLHYAYLNASFESGFTNPVDQAILVFRGFDISAYTKLGEVPYDFIRKRLSILVREADRSLMISKGALANILEVCSQAELSDGRIVALQEARDTIEQHFREFSEQGLRIMGVAYRYLDTQTAFSKAAEEDMTFLGFISLYDPIKPNITDVVEQLKQNGIRLKVITGDNHLVATSLAKQLGIKAPHILTGREIALLNNQALPRLAAKTDIFAEVEPIHKEMIILALRKAGNVVGYIGDGINDASALHSADVSISVDGAVDVAKEAADIVLLEKDLQVLSHGVLLGRTTFANTLKYVFMATSANFGNMFSMAGASLFLPFLPLLPKQVLLTNLLTDFPEMNIATDAVDPDMLVKPRRWNIKFIRQFMITFGLVSSIFDFLTFGLLLLVLHATPEQFRTGWFVESVVSASIIVLVVRTRKLFCRSKPGKALLLATLAVVIATLLIPYTPIISVMGFCPLPFRFMLFLVVIICAYIATAETAKRLFYKIVRRS